MKKHYRKYLLNGIYFIIFLIAAYNIYLIKKSLTTDALGARFFPTVILGLQTVLFFINTSKTDSDSFGDVSLINKRSLLCILLIASYIWILEKIGVFYATFLFMIIYELQYVDKLNFTTICSAIAISLFAYLLFGILFNLSFT